MIGPSTVLAFKCRCGSGVVYERAIPPGESAVASCPRCATKDLSILRVSTALRVLILANRLADEMGGQPTSELASIGDELNSLAANLHGASDDRKDV